jgi:hypothetical protein
MLASLAKVAQAGPKVDQSGWFPMAVFSFFWLVGIALLLASINMGRRRAAIAVTGGTLMLIQTGLFGVKQRTWQPGEVRAICAGPSGIKVNDRPVLELQVFDSENRKFGLLAGRANNELYWLAQELREVLQLRADG